MTPVRLFALAVSIGLLVGCGVPVKAPVPASGTIVAASHRDDAEYLAIDHSPITRAPVEVVASYTGSLPSFGPDEFKRRYGYMDYVVIQAIGTDGQPTGRLYAWTGDSSGVNTGLAKVKKGDHAIVRSSTGRIVWQGEVFLTNDYVAPVVKKAIASPSGQRVARICLANYPQPNLMLVDSNGSTMLWQAGSRDGDTYLDAQWLDEDTLLSYEGQDQDRLVFQEHPQGHYISQVLGTEELAQDGASAGLALDPDQPPLCTGTRHDGPVLTYTTRFFLKDGTKRAMTWQGQLQLGASGNVACVNRHPTSRAW